MIPMEIDPRFEMGLELLVLILEEIFPVIDETKNEKKILTIYHRRCTANDVKHQTRERAIYTQILKLYCSLEKREVKR